jgi:hypothetical protein
LTQSGRLTHAEGGDLRNRICNPASNYKAFCLLIGIITAAPPVLANGFSGMARIDETHYLAVHDDKSFETGSRISVIQVVADQNVIVTPLRPTKWEHNDGRSSDLEGVCAIPRRAGEFLLVESGHWAGNYGRLFHVKVDITKRLPQIKVLYAFDLPEFDAKGPGDLDGDEIEGRD